MRKKKIKKNFQILKKSTKKSKNQIEEKKKSQKIGNCSKKNL